MVKPFSRLFHIDFGFFRLFALFVFSLSSYNQRAQDTVYRHVSVLAFAAVFHLQHGRVQGTEADVDNLRRARLRQLHRHADLRYLPGRKPRAVLFHDENRIRRYLLTH